MLYIAQRTEERYFTVESLENFSCPALKEIDKRWLNSPSLKNHFGFSVQKEIWQKLGSPTYGSPIEDWRKFDIKVGWKTEESGIDSDEGYMRYDELGAFLDYKSSKRGNLPLRVWKVGWGRGWLLVRVDLRFEVRVLLFSLLANCNL